MITWELIVAISAYNFVMYVTPGPNNSILTTSGIKFGFFRSIPNIFGIPTGHGLQLALVCFGLGSLFTTFPILLDILRYVGAAYIIFLAYKMLGSLNISSTEGLGATPRQSPYTSAKHGVIGLTKSLAVELGSSGITINCICPGPIRTGMTEKIPEKDKEVYARRRVPLKRYGEPEEVAHATLNFCLPSSSFINGAVLPVDGGLTIKRA